MQLGGTTFLGNGGWGGQHGCMVRCKSSYASRAHKNRRLEEERVTPIEARSPGKIIEPY